MAKGSVVLLHGSVDGMGGRSECEVLARRLAVEPDSGSPRFYTYTDCSVVGASSDLPEGDYVARFDGYSFKATLHRGFWLSSGPAVRELDSEHAFGA